MLVVAADVGIPVGGGMVGEASESTGFDGSFPDINVATSRRGKNHGFAVRREEGLTVNAIAAGEPTPSRWFAGSAREDLQIVPRAERVEDDPARARNFN